MAYGLKALFYEKKDDENTRYEIEINGIVMPYMMIDKFGFKQVFLNEGYVDFMLEVTEDDINRMIFNHYGKEQYSYMFELNQELVCTLFEGDDCEKVCLWVYEYDSIEDSVISFDTMPTGVEESDSENLLTGADIGKKMNLAQVSEYEKTRVEIADSLDEQADTLYSLALDLALNGKWKEWSDSQPVGTVFNFTEEMMRDSGDKNVDMIMELYDKTLNIRDKIDSKIARKNIY